MDFYCDTGVHSSAVLHYWVWVKKSCLISLIKNEPPTLHKCNLRLNGGENMEKVEAILKHTLSFRNLWQVYAGEWTKKAVGYKIVLMELIHFILEEKLNIYIIQLLLFPPFVTFRIQNIFWLCVYWDRTDIQVWKLFYSSSMNTIIFIDPVCWFLFLLLSLYFGFSLFVNSTFNIFWISFLLS